MATHLVATFSDPQIKVNMGIYAGLPGVSAYHIFNAKYLASVRIHPDNSNLVQAEMSIEFDSGKKSWTLTHDSGYTGNEAMIVDTIDGVAPTSPTDLANKIAAMMR